MANLTIGDKIPSPVSARTNEHADKRAPSAENRDQSPGTSLQQDSIALGSGSANRLERPLSQGIGDAAEALGALRQLKAQIQAQPAAAVATHRGIGQTQVNTLLQPLVS